MAETKGPVGAIAELLRDVGVSRARAGLVEDGEVELIRLSHDPLLLSGAMRRAGRAPHMLPVVSSRVLVIAETRERLPNGEPPKVRRFGMTDPVDVSCHLPMPFIPSRSDRCNALQVGNTRPVRFFVIFTPKRMLLLCLAVLSIVLMI